MMLGATWSAAGFLQPPPGPAGHHCSGVARACPALGPRRVPLRRTGRSVVLPPMLTQLIYRPLRRSRLRRA